jgi:hypothetical protein
MGRNSANKSKEPLKPQNKKRMNWEGDHADFVIGLFVKNYAAYKKNKASATRHWAKNLAKHERFKKLNITDQQIKNFVAAQQRDFLRAVEVKDSTGFGDDEGGDAVEQLVEICKYWY